MTEYYVRSPWGRQKIEAGRDTEAIDVAYEYMNRYKLEWIAIDRIEKTLIFDTRPQEEDHDA